MVTSKISIDKKDRNIPVARVIYGDRDTSVIRLIIDRFSSDIDLSGLGWSIKIVNGENSDVVPFTPEVLDKTLEYDWVLPAVVSSNPGLCEIEIEGVNAESEQVWQSGKRLIRVDNDLDAEPGYDPESLSELQIAVYNATTKVSEVIEQLDSVDGKVADAVNKAIEAAEEANAQAEFASRCSSDAIVATVRTDAAIEAANDAAERVINVNSQMVTETREWLARLEVVAEDVEESGKAAQGIADEVQRKLDNGELNGKDGKTPVKGVDYFDGRDGYTPIKGKDYFDGQDGYTPIKGVDYVDGRDGRDGVATTAQDVRDALGYTPADESNTATKEALLQLLPIVEDMAVTVGNGGDYVTINDAVNALSVKPHENGVTATVMLKSGFVMSEQLTVEGIDLSWISIESEDDVVEVDGTGFGVNIDIPAHGGYSAVRIASAFASIHGGYLPIINALFEFVGETGRNRTGITAYDNSSVSVGKGCGIKHGQTNLYLTGSAYGYAFSGVFDDSYDHAINVFRTSILAGGAISGCNAGNIGCYVDSNSTAELSHAHFNNCTNGGLRVETGCNCAATELNVSSNTNGYGLEVANGGRFSGRDINADGCKDGISAKSGAVISIVSGTAKNCTEYGLYAQSSHGVVSGVDLSGAGKNGAYASASNIQLSSSNCRKNEAVDAVDDIVCSEGSLINLNANTLGGTNNPAGFQSHAGLIIGRNPVYELIKTQTVSAETTSAIQINKDNNGNAFYLLSVRVIVHSSPKSAESTAVNTEVVFRRSGSGVSSVKIPDSVTGSHRYYTADMYLRDGMWICEGVSGQTSAYSDGTLIRNQRPTPKFITDANCIDRIDLSGMVTAGTTISVYGIRRS